MKKITVYILDENGKLKGTATMSLRKNIDLNDFSEREEKVRQICGKFFKPGDFVTWKQDGCDEGFIA